MVFVAGPRQAGKSTLAQHVVDEAGGTWLTLDDADVLDAARTDPVGFVSGRRGLVGIDEAQRVPELLLAIKAEVDRARMPGRFLLTGSTRLLGAPKLADSLAGRMEALTLWPFAQSELAGMGAPALIDSAFGDSLADLDPPAVSRSDVLERAEGGGFLPALERSGLRRTAWFDSYVTAVVDREVRVLADASYLRELPRLLRLCAARTSGELNVADLARDLGLRRSTVESYLAHLEAVFLIQTVPAWSTNLTSRVVRRPKLTITDSGLAARLLGGRLRRDPELAGRLIETFVVGELRAQAEWSEARPNLFHLRDRDGAEVDLVMESGDGRVVGIEVKAGATVRAEDLRGLRLLESRYGPDFVAGIVLCTVPEPRHLGGRLWIMPMSALWQPTTLSPAPPT
ncbi:ATP-binding protein [Pseudonocardia sp. TRM90224]|uniref:ATP-binding protein n=1 Tax=Pseudonocardia sp. TRM90224 TaxID=2812678 RepID=UPI001E34ED37|nr:ATP-binding protein [Pseudonocardia sp. TRM90224]